MAIMKVFTSRPVPEGTNAEGTFSLRAVFCAASMLTASVVGAFPSPKISNVATAVTKGPLARVDVTYRLSEPAIVLCDVLTNVTGTASGDEYASIGADMR